MTRIAYWTSEAAPMIRALVRVLRDRSETLDLRVSGLEAATLIELTAFGAIPDPATESNNYEIKIPVLGSIIGSLSLTSKEVGLTDFPSCNSVFAGRANRLSSPQTRRSENRRSPALSGPRRCCRRRGPAGRRRTTR